MILNTSYTPSVNRPYNRYQRRQSSSTKHTFDTVDRKYLVGSVGRKHYHNNALAYWLHSVFGKIMGPWMVDDCLEHYAIGTSKSGQTVYWNLDQWGNIRSALLADVNPSTGKIDRDNNNLMFHQLKNTSCPANFRFVPAFFGSHTLPWADMMGELKTMLARADGVECTLKPTLWIFESVRAAMLMRLYLQWADAENVFYPIAATPLCSFNPTEQSIQDPTDRHYLLKGRRVVLFPNSGNYHSWLTASKRIAHHCEYIKVSTIMHPDLHRTKIDFPISPGDGVDTLLLHYINNGMIDRFDDINIY